MKNYRYHWVAAILVLLDQATKLAVKGFSLFGFTHEGMRLGEVIPLAGNTVRLTYIENAGSAFGLEWGEAKIVLTLATIVIAGGLVWYLRKLSTAKPILQIAVMLLLAGAVGNLIDRVFYGVAYGHAPLFLGSVVDFIQVDIPDIQMFGVYWTHWPVFNIADSCVSVGIVLLLLFGGKQSQNDISPQQQIIASTDANEAPLPTSDAPTQPDDNGAHTR